MFIRLGHTHILFSFAHYLQAADVEIPTPPGTSKSRGEYFRFSARDDDARQKTLPFAEPDGIKENCKSWRAPLFMFTSLTIGMGIALAHHFMCWSLDARAIGDIVVSQAWIFRISTALAFLVKIALAIGVGTAYIQHQWLLLRQKGFKTVEVDSMTSVLGNVFSFFSSAVWFSHPLLALMALVSW